MLTQNKRIEQIDLGQMCIRQVQGAEREERYTEKEKYKVTKIENE